MMTSTLQQYLDNREVPSDRIAVTDGRTIITYGELADRSSRLATVLRDLGAGAGERVIVCLRRSAEFLPAVVGVLKAGAAYVPLDPKSPPDRWQRIISDCAPAALLCDRQTLPLLAAAAPESARVFLDARMHLPAGIGAVTTLEDIAAVPTTSPEVPNQADDLAYILYTSGSTGQPKGVMISHGNVRNYIDWAVERFAIGSGDRILGTAPFHFDMSTFDLWCALKAGATLCIADEKLMLFPEQLVQFMEREGVTIWKGIPSLHLYLERAGVLAPGRIPVLTRVLFGGEAMPARTLMRWMETFPEKSFFNVYGPTEATGVSFCFRVERMPGGAGERIPIGRPCKGMEAVLVDESLAPVPPGERGELLLSGPGVGHGYLNDQERTERHFIVAALSRGTARTWYRTGDLAVQRADGLFEYLGRKDDQVKVMGYRIELGEIEQALRAIDGIREAAVISREREGVAELIAFVEGEEETVDTARILRHLREKLPPYMLPRRLVPLPGLPRCGRGKIDRLSLRGLALEGPHAAG